MTALSESDFDNAQTRKAIRQAFGNPVTDNLDPKVVKALKVVDNRTPLFELDKPLFPYRMR